VLTVFRHTSLPKPAAVLSTRLRLRGK
jgi:hypothetical protein